MDIWYFKNDTMVPRISFVNPKFVTSLGHCIGLKFEHFQIIVPVTLRHGPKLQYQTISWEALR